MAYNDVGHTIYNQKYAVLAENKMLLSADHDMR